jgi:hypothetical protein
VIQPAFDSGPGPLAQSWGNGLEKSAAGIPNPIPNALNGAAQAATRQAEGDSRTSLLEQLRLQRKGRKGPPARVKRPRPPRADWTSLAARHLASVSGIRQKGGRMTDRKASAAVVRIATWISGARRRRHTAGLRRATRVEVRHPSRLRQEGVDTDASWKATRLASAGKDAGSGHEADANPAASAEERRRDAAGWGFQVLP